MPPTPDSIPLLVVHGIGLAHAGYADELIGGVERELRTALTRCLRPIRRPELPCLAASAALWDRCVSPQQAALQDVLKGTIAPVRFAGPWWGWWRPLLRRKLLKLRQRLVPFLGDILAYQRRDATTLIQEELDASLSRLGQPQGTSPMPLTVVAHSLGTVIASDYLWDRTRSGHRGGMAGFRLHNLFTMGSPMAFYALKYAQGIDEFDQPLSMESAEGCWVNIYDPDDLIATPLRCLNAAYRQAVLHDAQVRTGTVITAHTGYWSNADVHRIIGHKLALDWLEHHQAASTQRLAQLRQRYAQRLTLT